MRNRDNMGSADQAEGGFKTNNPVGTGWTGDRAIGLRADCRCGEARCDRRSAATGRSARGAIEDMRISRQAANRAPSTRRIARADI
jgi:hypothetical protein